jgi:hypothetical protein
MGNLGARRIVKGEGTDQNQIFGEVEILVENIEYVRPNKIG